MTNLALYKREMKGSIKLLIIFCAIIITVSRVNSSCLRLRNLWIGETK